MPIKPFQAKSRQHGFEDVVAAALKPVNESAQERADRLSEEARAKKWSEQIDKEIEVEKKRSKGDRQVIKVLLLGPAESGKSTFLKQLRLRYDRPALEQERESYRQVILLSIVQSVRALLFILENDATPSALPANSVTSPTLPASRSPPQSVSQSSSSHELRKTVSSAALTKDATGQQLSSGEALATPTPSQAMLTPSSFNDVGAGFASTNGVGNGTSSPRSPRTSQLASQSTSPTQNHSAQFASGSSYPLSPSAGSSLSKSAGNRDPSLLRRLRLAPVLGLEESIRSRVGAIDVMPGALASLGLSNGPGGIAAMKRKGSSPNLTGGAVNAVAFIGLGLGLANGVDSSDRGDDKRATDGEDLTGRMSPRPTEIDVLVHPAKWRTASGLPEKSTWLPEPKSSSKPTNGHDSDSGSELIGGWGTGGKKVLGEGDPNDRNLSDGRNGVVLKKSKGVTVDDPAQLLALCKADVRELYEAAIMKGLVGDGEGKLGKWDLGESATYYLDNLDRICEQGYVPSDTDILRCRIRTIGVDEHHLRVNELIYHIADVAGAKGSRHAWAAYFEDAIAIVYVCAISAYDESLAEEPSVNRMRDALSLFGQLCRNKLLAKAEPILFLNKTDILRDKLKSKRSPVKKYFPEYKGEDRLEDVCRFFRAGFKARAEPRIVFTHFTCSLDTRAIGGTIASVNDQLLRRSLTDAGLV